MNCRKVWTILPMGAVFAVAFLLAPGAIAAGMGHGDGMMHGKEHAESGPESGMCGTCQALTSQMNSLAKVNQLLTEAKAAAKAAGDDKALAKIDEALKLLSDEHMGLHSMMHQHMEDAHKDMMQQAMNDESLKCPMCGNSMVRTVDENKIVNVRCPITGNKIDPDNVPANLTREWNGQKVGFCCAGCPPVWDKLDDAHKQAKLDAAKAKTPDEDDNGGHMMHHHG